MNDLVGFVWFVFYFLLFGWALAYAGLKWNADIQARIGPTEPGKRGILFPVVNTLSVYSLSFRSCSTGRIASLGDLASGIAAAAALFLPIFPQAELGKMAYSLAGLAGVAFLCDLIKFIEEHFSGSSIKQVQALRTMRLKLRLYLVALLAAAAFIFLAQSLSTTGISDESLIVQRPILGLQALVLGLILAIYSNAHPFCIDAKPEQKTVSHQFLCWVLLNMLVTMIIGNNGGIAGTSAVSFCVVLTWMFFARALPRISFVNLERLVGAAASLSLVGWVLLFVAIWGGER